MIIKGDSLAQEKGLKLYPLESTEVAGNHFGVWVTTPDHPFKAHKHGQREIWFIMEGTATVTLDGEEYTVEAGDLVELSPWVEHGLRAEEGTVTWICMG
jgi:mannose-6-phosphate isomerase-like protein (cupin superfamily)